MTEAAPDVGPRVVRTLGAAGGQGARRSEPLGLHPGPRAGAAGPRLPRCPAAARGPVPRGPSWWWWPTAPAQTSSRAWRGTKTWSWSSTGKTWDSPAAAIRLRPWQGPRCSSSSTTTARLTKDASRHWSERRRRTRRSVLSGPASCRSTARWRRRGRSCGVTGPLPTWGRVCRPGPMPIGNPETSTTPQRTGCWSPGGRGTLWAGSTNATSRLISRMSTSAWRWPSAASGSATSRRLWWSTRGARAPRPSFENSSCGATSGSWWKNGVGALDRFEPRPAKDSGPAFDAAVERAIKRTQARVNSSGTVAAGAGAGGLQRRAVSADPSQAAADLRAEYQAYLEQRVADGDRRVTTLETYLSGLWGVRLRRRVGGWLNRRQS